MEMSRFACQAANSPHAKRTRLQRQVYIEQKTALLRMRLLPCCNCGVSDRRDSHPDLNCLDSHY